MIKKKRMTMNSKVTKELFTLVEKNRKTQINKKNEYDSDFIECLNKAKIQFVDEMNSICMKTYIEFYNDVNCENETRFSRKLDISKDYFTSRIDIKGKFKTYSFSRHELWYGKLNKSRYWLDRIKRTDDCVFNDLRNKLLKEKLFIYDLSDPTRSISIHIYLSITPFEKRKELWHNMNY